MSEQKPNNFCPLPWISESHEIGGKARLCCHQERTPYSEDILNKSSYLSSTDTEVHRKARQAFQQGKTPDECQYCFSSQDWFSPAQDYQKIFSQSSNQILKSSPQDFLTPLKTKYLDLTLDSVCNLKCRMCSPQYSKGIEAEWVKMGIPFQSPQTNEDAMLLKLERLLPNLKMLTLTGGEPFLSPSFPKILDLTQKYRKDIILRIYTNASFFPTSFFPKLKQFKELQLFLSIDGVGETQEYIRHPLNWNKQEVAIEQWLDHSSSQIKISTHLVLQALNATRIVDLLEFFLPFSNKITVFPSVTLLTSPSHLCPNVLPKKLLIESIQKIEQWYDCNREEIDRNKSHENLLGLNQLRAMFNFSIEKNRFENDFINFVLLSKKLDLIKKQSFHLLFPEFQEHL